MYEFIPSELKKLNNWVCWRAVQDEKSHSGISKIPVNPKTGGMAQSNNPDTWSDFDTAVRVSADLAGIGFMFDGSGYFGVDLDDVKSAVEDFRNGITDNIIGEFVYGLRSYTELSFSGNGVHIICKGKLPPGNRRSKKVEMYEKGRFFVMTGNYCSEFIDIRDCTENIKPLHGKYLGEKTAAPSQGTSVSVPAGLTASQIIEKARNSSKGQKFDALYSGDISGYASQSEADMAFCNLLAFWCQCDINLMDEIYRSSALMRPKWDRAQSGSTYGMLTLRKAADSCRETYNPVRKTSDNGYDISIIGSSEESKYSCEKYYSFDDTGNAERMEDAYGENLRYSYVDKRWMFYRNGKWNYDNIGEVFRVADATLDLMKQEGETLYPEWKDEDIFKLWKKHVTRTRSNTAKKAMVKELEHRVPILPRNLDTDKFAVNCKNGIIELNDLKLMPHRKERYMTKMLNAAYDSSAPEPIKWFEFLDSIFAGNRELIRYIQKACGYCLSGSTQEQCVFFLYGSGRNGKSTFLEIVRYIFGDYATNIQPDTIMVRKKANGAANSDIARLKGARLVTSVEPNEGARLDEGLIKQLTGGDVVTARKLYGDEFEFKPEFKLWMATNHKPIIRGTDTGIWRRIHLIPFGVQIPEDKVDKHLKYKLHKELSGIFRWIVEGFRLWKEEGLELPACMKDAVTEYRHEMDVISGFVDACCVVGEGETKANSLFYAYRKWAENDKEYVMSNTKFGTEMSKKFQKVRTVDGYVYKGIKLIDDYQGDNPYSISIG